MTALHLALDAQVSIQNPYFALSRYLVATQDQRRGLELGQAVLSQLETYPSDKLSGQLGTEFARIIGDIALRQTALKQYAAAETSQKKKLNLVDRLEHVDEKERSSMKATSYHNLGIVAQEQRQWQQARDYFLTALATYVDYDDTHNGGIVLGSLARLWQASEDKSLPAAVASTLGASVEETEALLRETLGSGPGEAGG